MRIVKLSAQDPDMLTLNMVDHFFTVTLPNRNPPGKFRLTINRIGKEGLNEREKLIFTYKSKIIYVAETCSDRLDNDDLESKKYPYYFIIDMTSLTRAKGELADLEKLLFTKGLIDKNIVQSQGWPKLIDTPGLFNVWESLKLNQ